MSSDASMPRTSRWNFSAAAARRASAMPEERGSDAASLTGGSPPWWRATPTRSVSALIRIAPSAARVPRKAHSQSIRPGAPQVGGAQAEADQHRRVAQVGADPVQVDAGERELLLPAGDLAVDAVEQQVELDQHARRARRPAMPGTSRAGAARTPTTVIR